MTVTALENAIVSAARALAKACGPYFGGAGPFSLYELNAALSAYDAAPPGNRPMSDRMHALEAARRLIRRRAEAVAWDRESGIASLDDGDAVIVARALLACTERAEAAEAALAKVREIAEAAAIDLYANGLVVCAANIRAALAALPGEG